VGVGGRNACGQVRSRVSTAKPVAPGVACGARCGVRAALPDDLINSDGGGGGAKSKSARELEIGRSIIERGFAIGALLSAIIIPRNKLRDYTL
jgi:hypothetical protein